MSRVEQFWQNVFIAWLLAGIVFFSLEAEAANGLGKVKTNLETFRDEILSIVPIIAIIALILLGIAYALNTVEKSTFFRWAIGIIIVGSAAQITNIFMT